VNRESSEAIRKRWKTGSKHPYKLRFPFKGTLALYNQPLQPEVEKRTDD
jgi:hypothetical protein